MNNEQLLNRIVELEADNERWIKRVKLLEARLEKIRKASEGRND